MLRPQGLFQHRLPAPAEWQQQAPPAPGAYPPPGGGYQQSGQYQQGGPWSPPSGPPAPPAPGNPYPQGNQYPPGAPAQPWGPGPAGTATGQPGYPPSGQFPQGGAYPDPYGGAQFPGGQFPPGPFPGGQFGPGAQFGPDGTPLAGGGAGARALFSKLPLKRPTGRAVPLAVAAGVAVVVVVALVLSSGGGSGGNAPAGGTVAATQSATASTPATGLAQRQAATALSGLLAQSGGDRADVGAAVLNVESCGKNIAKDVRVFTKAAANRRALLAKLGQLPGRSALPPAMLSDLTNGWTASARVDTDLAAWAQDQVGHCKKGNTKDAHYAATIPYDSEATNNKNAFVALWNPLASEDGLPTRQSSDL